MRRGWIGRIAADVALLGLLFAAKVAVGAYVLAHGFTHISDDDYARVVIAEQFAHHSVLDPSGTSWLPFPFWLAGGAMMALGRSLAVAQELAFAIGVVSIAAPYVAMRVAGCGRATAAGAVAVALALPWNAWVGVATVPEALTACFTAGAAIAVTSERARPLAGVALFAAALSRYEAWPVCAVFAATCLRAWSKDRAGRRSSHGSLVAAAIALAGPLLWMLWNAHAHGSPLHFVARVAAYRQAIGAAAIPLSRKLAAFPLALATASPLIVGLSLAGAAALPLDATLRRRWLPPLTAAGATLAFLVYGDLHDGAPTHHPERAVLPILWILGPFAADALRTLVARFVWRRPAREACAFGVSVAAAVAWVALLPARLRDAPGTSDDESRRAQVERGLELARTAGPDEHWTVTPCAYEHFALVAAEGEPERFTRVSSGRSLAPSTRAPVTAACPLLEPER